MDIQLIYCVQDETRAHFSRELEDIAAKTAGFRMRLHCFAREGPLNAAFIASRCPDFAERAIFLCGPAPLLAETRSILRRAGVPVSKLRSEDFTWL